MNRKETMEQEIAKLKDTLRSLAEEERAQAGEHPTVERLTAYHFNKLSDQESEQIQDHLAMCRECASLLLDLAEFCVSGEARPLLVASVEIEPPSPAMEPPTPSLFQLFRERRSPFRFIHALALLGIASSLLLAIWITLLNQRSQDQIARLKQDQIARQAEAAKEVETARRQSDEARERAARIEKQLGDSRRELDDLTKPQLNVPIVDLPLGQPRAAEADRLVIRLPAQAARFTLIIPAPTAEIKYSGYAIEIFNESGAPVISEKGLRLDPESGFTLSLSCRSFPAGKYRFDVYGIVRGGRTRVARDVALIRYK